MSSRPDREYVYLKIPADDWWQIESDIEDMAGGEAEILADVQRFTPHCCACAGDCKVCEEHGN